MTPRLPSRGEGKPRLLDLFCGAGGATRGYQRAGFYVIGIDVVDQPNYAGDEFVQADAISVLKCLSGRGFDFAPGITGREFVAVHASPPCPRYSTITRDKSRHPDLYGATRDLLDDIGLPWVIENVIGAPYGSGIVLCGSMFGMEVRRHRNFETSWLMMQPDHPCRFETRPYTITGHGDGPNGHESRHHRGPAKADGPRLMGCDWMTWEECVLAVPPSYTEWIGTRLLEQIAVIAP